MVCQVGSTRYPIKCVSHLVFIFCNDDSNSFPLLFLRQAEKWLEDKDLSGARYYEHTEHNPNEEEEEEVEVEVNNDSSDDNSSDNNSDDNNSNSSVNDSDEGATATTMPARASSKKSPAPKARVGTSKSPPRPPSTRKKANKQPIDESYINIDELNKDFKKKLALQSFVDKCKIQGYETGIVAWKDPSTQQVFLDIRLEVPLRIKKINLDPPPVLDPTNNKRVKIWVKQYPKSAEFDPCLFPSVVVDQHANADLSRMDIETKIEAFETACQAVKKSFGSQQVEEVVIDLPFACDSKGFYDPIAGEAKSAVKLITTEITDPDDESIFYPVRLLILMLEAAEKPLEDVEISEENTSSKKSARDYLEKRKQARFAGRARMAGFIVPDDDDDEKMADPVGSA